MEWDALDQCIQIEVEVWSTLVNIDLGLFGIEVLGALVSMDPLAFTIFGALASIDRKLKWDALDRCILIEVEVLGALVSIDLVLFAIFMPSGPATGHAARPR